MRNWAGNQAAPPARVVRPASTPEVALAVRSAAADGLRVKPVGAGHSFTGAALTSGVLLELDRLASVVSIDGALVTVQAGMRLSELNRVLASHGLALPNLGDIDVQTVSGAIATGTHGTGARLPCLAAFVAGLTLVTGTGEVVRCAPASDTFSAAAVGVGAVGVLTEVTLRCVPAFVLRADERPMPLSTVLASFDQLASENDHFEFYWFPYTERALTKRNNRVDASDAPLSKFRGWLDDELLSNRVFGWACRLGRAAPGLVPVVSGVSARALSARVYTAPSYEV